MTAENPSPFVPKLRFSEFAQGPGWNHARMADLVETVTPPKKLTTSTYLVGGRFPIIDQSTSYICGWTDDDEAVITRPLPVIVFGDHTCVLKFIDQPFAQGADGIKIFTARRSVSTVYLYHQLSHRPVVMEQYKRHFSTLKNKVVFFPDPKSGEQQKIADCFGSVDDLIAAESRKLKALRQHKQGLMQQLFPQPGETVPRLRFPEFVQGAGWEHATVAELVETVTPPKKLTTSTYVADGRFPIIDQSQSYICGWTNDDEAVITRPLPVIVFGDHTCVLKFVNRQFAQGADGIKILTASRRVSPLFLYHQLTYRPVVTKEYKRHFSELKEKVVYFPDPKAGEQQKIAECLSSLDDLIAAEGRMLDALRHHKQGLMQQLFPSLEGESR